MDLLQCDSRRLRTGAYTDGTSSPAVRGDGPCHTTRDPPPATSYWANPQAAPVVAKADRGEALDAPPAELASLGTAPASPPTAVLVAEPAGDPSTSSAAPGLSCRPPRICSYPSHPIKISVGAAPSADPDRAPVAGHPQGLAFVLALWTRLDPA
jgi:hypothetical protein